MSSEPSSSKPVDGTVASGSGTRGWPARTDNSAEWWGRRQLAPAPRDPNRLTMFAKPVHMSQEERTRILSNWKKMAKDWPETKAMNPELRPSTPREDRADNKIQKLKNEGVNVDLKMQEHIRNVVTKNSGLHEALRHYTEGESNELIPYMNEMLRREDMMLVEWAKQRKADYEFWKNYSLHGGSSRGGRNDAKSSSTRSSRSTTKYEDPSPNSKKPVKELSPSDDEADPQDEDHVGPRNEPSPTGSPTQRESSKAKSSKASLAKAKRAEEGRKAQDRHAALQQERLATLVKIEAQIADVDRQLWRLNGSDANSIPMANWPHFEHQDPFDRIFEVLRKVLERKQRKLVSLNQRRSPEVARPVRSRLLGSLRSVLRGRNDSGGSTDEYVSRRGS